MGIAPSSEALHAELVRLTLIGAYDAELNDATFGIKIGTAAERVADVLILRMHAKGLVVVCKEEIPLIDRRGRPVLWRPPPPDDQGDDEKEVEEGEKVPVLTLKVELIADPEAKGSDSGPSGGNRVKPSAKWTSMAHVDECVEKAHRAKHAKDSERFRYINRVSPYGGLRAIVAEAAVLVIGSSDLIGSGGDWTIEKGGATSVDDAQMGEALPALAKALVALSQKMKETL